MKKSIANLYCLPMRATWLRKVAFASGWRWELKP